MSNTLGNLTGSVICNQLALHFNEQLKHTGHYKQNLKKFGNMYNKELIKAERDQFDKVFEADEEMSHYLSSTLHDFIVMITKTGFIDFTIMQTIIRAYKINPKSIEGITKKILTNEN
jgi:hypothetical protein